MDHMHLNLMDDCCDSGYVKVALQHQHKCPLSLRVAKKNLTFLDVVCSLCQVLQNLKGMHNVNTH